MNGYDQTAPEFLNQMRVFGQGLLAWLQQEGAEGHHPPDLQQHQQTLQQPQPDAGLQQPVMQSTGAPQDADVNEPPPYPKKAAGMLLMAPDGRALFVRRQGDDHPGEWSLPGGMTKGDEHPWQTAHREAQEELGPFDCDRMQLIDHSLDQNTGLGFTTFGAKVNDAFNPRLNHEHDAFQWAHPNAPPQPLHPGLRSTLDFAQDPLTEKGQKIMSSMQSQYGPEKGKSVFYASKNAGKITGVDNPMDAIPTSGRRDTQIHTIHPAGPHGASNPFSANIDNQQWASPRWDATPNVTKPAAATANPTAVRPTTTTLRSTDTGWASPSWNTDQASTGKTQEIASAVQGKVRDPQAVAAATRAKMIGRPALQAKAAAARSGNDTRQSDPLKRYKLYDSQGGILYDIDRPLPIARSSTIATEIGGEDDAWSGQPASDPMTKPAMQAPHQMSTAPTPGMGGMRSAPQPGAPMGGGPMAQRGQMGGAAAMAGPKYTQSVKMDYGGGFVDERKLTRPGGPPPAAQQWASPKWQSPGQQQDAWPTQQQPQPPRPQDQWPNAGTLGPSAKGGGGRI